MLNIQIDNNQVIIKEILDLPVDTKPLEEGVPIVPTETNIETTIYNKEEQTSLTIEDKIKFKNKYIETKEIRKSIKSKLNEEELKWLDWFQIELTTNDHSRDSAKVMKNLSEVNKLKEEK